MKSVHFWKFWNFEICKEIKKLWWKSNKKLCERQLYNRRYYTIAGSIFDYDVIDRNVTLVTLPSWSFYDDLRKKKYGNQVLYSPKAKTLKEEVRRDLFVSKDRPQSQNLAKFKLETIVIVCLYICCFYLKNKYAGLV